MTASEQMIEALTARHASTDKVLNETRPLAEIRADLAEKAAAQELPPDIEFEPVDAGGVPAIWVTPPGVQRDLVYLFFHGGAYVKRVVSINHNVVIGVCQGLNARGLSVDYRVGPEDPYPAAVDDAFASYCYLLDQGIDPGRIVVGGSSAGGGLALALLLSCREHDVPTPAAAVPISPWSDLTNSGESVSSRADRDPAMTPRYLDRFAAEYLQEADPRLPLASPLFADYAGLECPILIQVGSEELLYDDAARVVAKAKSAGVDARLEVYDQAFHGWQNRRHLPEAIEASRSAALFALEHTTESATAAAG